ncbi:MAG TPA: TetR/AcrR family transcriptional regulator [Microthrixaceae bacterium]|nr:TetR/AcrR family transcriptional regulator [Microthrixaceae bacterium]
MALTEPSTEATADRGSIERRSAYAEAILLAAHRLVDEKGEAFTTQELIKEAGVALQTFYRQYGGKDELLIAVIEDRIRGHCLVLEEQARLFDDPVERLRLFVTASVDGLVDESTASAARFMTSQHWRLHQVRPEAISAATKPFADLVQRALEEGRADGSLSPRNPERDAWLITKVVMSVFHHYAFVPDDPAIETAADDVWQFCLAAVGGK